MESLKDFGEVVITIQACVIKKFLQGFMAPKQKKKKKAAAEETGKVEEVDEEKKLAEEARVRTHTHPPTPEPRGPCTFYLPLSPSCVWFLPGFSQVATAVEKWKGAIREAQTFSRMHVLLGMLDACIKWDMSAENARCKVCRKKGEGGRPAGGAAPIRTFHRRISRELSSAVSVAAPLTVSPLPVQHSGRAQRRC